MAYTSVLRWSLMYVLFYELLMCVCHVARLGFMPQAQFLWTRLTPSVRDEVVRLNTRRVDESNLNCSFKWMVCTDTSCLVCPIFSPGWQTGQAGHTLIHIRRSHFHNTTFGQSKVCFFFEIMVHWFCETTHDELVLTLSLSLQRWVLHQNVHPVVLYCLRCN